MWVGLPVFSRDHLDLEKKFNATFLHKCISTKLLNNTTKISLKVEPTKEILKHQKLCALTNGLTNSQDL